MTFLISLAVSVLFIALSEKRLREHPVPFYIASALIAAAGTLTVWSNARTPAVISDYVLPVISRGGLSGALFVIVMVTGALPNGTYLMKKLMPIRGPLSIIASIFTLGHNAAYGKTYFRLLFVTPGRMPVTQLIAAVCSLIMIVIMLPLFITSFRRVRSKMKLKTWKKLQRAAYVFYALLITHILLLCVPYALQDRAGYRLTVFVYGSIFLFYLIARLSKFFALRAHRAGMLARFDAAVLALVLCATGAACLLMSGGASGTVTAETQAAETAAAPAQAETGEAAADPEETLTDAAADEPAESQTETEEAVAEPAEAQTEAAASPSKEQTGGVMAGSAAQDTKSETEGTSNRIWYDGVYEGTAFGNSGNITVQVTLENDRITDITILKHNEDDPYWTWALDVIGWIYEANSTDVDCVTGATFSSGGIIDAVDKALKSAEIG